MNKIGWAKTAGLLLLLAGGLWSADIAIAWAQSGGEAISVDESGNVGIGSQKPTKKLDVAGDAHVSGDVQSEGTVKAVRYEGDATSLTVKGATSLQTALDSKYDKAWGRNHRAGHRKTAYGEYNHGFRVCQGRRSLMFKHCSPRLKFGPRIRCGIACTRATRWCTTMYLSP